MITKPNIEYNKGLFLDLYIPKSQNFDLFIYFHGGGLENGSKSDAKFFAHTLASQNIATASVEYRMYPTARFPNFITDCACAVRWLKDNISSFGNCNKIFIGGSSAGGYISMMLCFNGEYLTDVGVLPSEIAGYIHDAGQPTSHFNVLREFGEDSRRVVVDKTAPLYFVGSSKEYPPMLFIVSTNDLFARYEQTMLMVKTMQHFGHGDKVFLEVVNGSHCEYVCKQDSQGNGELAKIILKHFNNLNGC